VRTAGTTEAVRRITAAIVALAAAGGCVSGCGSGASGNASSYKTSGSGPSGTVTQRQARAYAQAVNLKASDVPELTAVRSEREATPKRLGEEAARCAGAESPSRRVADVNSAKFSGASASPRETVGSEVVVWPTASAAERNAAAETGARGRACVQHLLERLALRRITARVRVAHVSVAWRPSPLRGAKDAHAARVTLTVAAEASGARGGTSSVALESPVSGARRVRVPVYLDVEGFLSGPAQVGLTALGVGRPASAATEHRLLSLLYSRARARTP
jgi:hypothetical protein